MVICSVDAAFQDREIPVDSIGVGVTPNIFIRSVINRPVTGELFANLPINAAFVSPEMRIAATDAPGPATQGAKSAGKCNPDCDRRASSDGFSPGPGATTCRGIESCTPTAH